MARPNLLIVATLGIIFTVSECMRFDLLSGNTKCISEDIRIYSMTVGKYMVINPNESHPVPDAYKFSLRVSSPYGNNYHIADRVESGHFAFTAGEAGEYTACFWAYAHKPKVMVTIDFDWKSGVTAKDWSKLAKKGRIDGMELELKKLYDIVLAIKDEMFFLRGREEEMQQLNRSTNFKMAGLGFLSLVVCLSVAGLQFWHLKAYFERKKLL